MDVRRTRHVGMALAITVCNLLATVSHSAATAATSPEAEAYEPEDVVLRMETVGGFAPLPVLLLRVPAFTLYDDGLVIFQSPNASLMRVRLDPEGTDRLIEFALHEGGLADARGEYSAPGIADATTTVFTLALDGLEKQVSVHALGIDARGPERAAHRAFERLATTLADPGAWLPDDAEVAPYVPNAYLSLFAEEDAERSDLIDWPWDEIRLEDLRVFDEAPFYRTLVLMPDQLAALAPFRAEGDTLAYVRAPDGSAFRVMARPLLPDELPLGDAADQA